MARSNRRKTVSQHITNLATPGAPRWIKSKITSRWGARATIGSLIALVATGVISVTWENHRPRVSINRKKVAAIRSFTAETAGGLSGVLERRLQAAGGAPASGPANGRFGRDVNRAVYPRHPQSAQISIATFNIQVFGTSKAQNGAVMDVLAQTVRRFDLVAIQELRTTDPGVMEGFVQLINADGATYEYFVGERLGRTSSKEQYVFVYDAHRIEVDPSSVITFPDPQDLLHREPLVARFRARVAPPAQPFTFILVNIHTDPDETKTELDALADVFLSVQNNPWGEDDVILLGDLNVSHKKLGRLGQVPHIAYTVHGEPTNTRGTKSYDNIVFSQLATTEFTGQAGIVDLAAEFGLSNSQALKVSDHLPVWALFTSAEAGGQVVASRPAQSPRRQPLYEQPAGPAGQPQHAQRQYAQQQYAQQQYSQPQYVQPRQYEQRQPAAQDPRLQPARQQSPAAHPNANPRRFNLQRARDFLNR